VKGYDAALYTCRAFNLEDSIDGDATLTVQGALIGRCLFMFVVEFVTLYTVNHKNV